MTMLSENNNIQTKNYEIETILHSKRFRHRSRKSFEVIIKIAWIFKTKRISNIRNTPVCMQNQCFCFTYNSFGNMGRSGFSGHFFYRPV